MCAWLSLGPLPCPASHRLVPRGPASAAQYRGEVHDDDNADENAEGDDYFFASLLIHDIARLVFKRTEHYASSYNLKKHTLFRKRSVQLSTAKRKAPPGALPNGTFDLTKMAGLMDDYFTRTIRRTSVKRPAWIR